MVSEVCMELSKNIIVKEMYVNIKNFCEERKYENSLKALSYAYEMHQGATRIGGDPYIIHPLGVAWQGILLGVDSDVEIAIGLLHDVPEDCNTTMDDLDIDPLIKHITNDILNVHKFERKNWNKHERNRLNFEAIARSELATMIKLGDTNNNLSTMNKDFSPEKRLKNVIEKREFMYPLLEYAEKIYADNPRRKAQIAFYKKWIHFYVEQMDASLGEKGTKLRRTKFIA